MKPRYQYLRDNLLKDFLSQPGVRVGEKLPTERELEMRYGVSRPTISKAIAALAAEGWVTKRQGSGIYIAAIEKCSDQEKDRQKPQIGYVTPSLRPVLSHRVFEGIEFVTGRSGYAVEAASTGWDAEIERQKIASMREHGVQGVVLYPTPYRPAGKEYLAQEFQDFPIVVVDLYQPAMKRPHFLFDNFQAGREITAHLLAQGPRDIAFLKYATTYRSVDERLAGYRRALEDAGMPFLPERVLAFDGKGPMTEGHIEALERMLALNPRPTALITPYDPYAEASIEYLRSSGLSVPDEMVVAGFDDLHDEKWGESFPTTRPDFMRMGERAAELLIERIASRSFEPTEVVMPCPVVFAERKTFASAAENWQASTKDACLT